MTDEPPSETPLRQSLHQVACRIYAARRERARMFQPGLFTDPAWDILLLLYCAEGEGKSLSVTSVCLATDVSQSTALRKIYRLVDLGLLEMSGHEHDRRSRLVRLTESARNRLDRYFASVEKSLMLCTSCSCAIAGAS